MYQVLNDLIQEYDPIEDKWECEQTLVGHQRYINALCVLPGNKLASGSNDKTIKIWNIATGKCEQTLLGHERLCLCTMCIAGK